MQVKVKASVKVYDKVRIKVSVNIEFNVALGECGGAGPVWDGGTGSGSYEKLCVCCVICIWFNTLMSANSCFVRYYIKKKR